MINNFQDFQKFGQTNVDTALKLFGDWNKGWQAIAAEMTDYSKRAFEDGTATFEKLAAAKSLEQAFEIQSSFAKRAYEDYMQQLTKIGGMYTNLAKDAYKPVEKAFQSAR
ncbi:phasin family protein [Hyphomicrobium sp.]|uniref:phasin family protein n=1 Tax=Hyphomicrobium sp. TaxID=82 RepID=UPI0025BC6282|nr:phasin family protein [Hyphomicrobium sp.]MCC7253765.1 phasin family protein [Hyphomicrobium sp.]